MGLTDKIIAFESGEMNNQQTVDLFATLVKNGMAWTLQGVYGRIATDLIRAGILSRNGKVLRYPEDTPEELT